MTQRVLTWRGAATGSAVLTLAVLLVFWSTFTTMVAIWADVETYSHGFLILPISLWLVWRERETLSTMAPAPAPWVLMLTLGSAALWALSLLLGVQVGEQLALVALWTSALWALVGHRAARVLAFPLAFLFLMVPMGDSLVPPMMDFTADFTVWMLEMTGVPVYREGLYFVIPSGNWSVVEACSGVRYLIASFTLGLLYAYLTYRTWWRRGAFVLLAIIVPIIANGLRAYMIVMIGHLSDMRLAVGVDHLIYGWVFFGLVMFLLFWLGNFWVERDPATPPAHKTSQGRVAPGAPAVAGAVVLAAVGLAVGARAAVAELSTAQADNPQVVLPANAGGWTLAEPPALTWPITLGSADQVIHVDYVKQDQRVSLVLGVFFTQRQGHEVVSSQNSILDRNASLQWRIAGHHTMKLAVNDAPMTAPVVRIAKTQGTLFDDSTMMMSGTYWYRLGGRSAVNEYLGKWYQALELLFGGRRDGAFIALVTKEQEGLDSHPDATLRAFVAQAMPAIFATLDAPYRN